MKKQYGPLTSLFGKMLSGIKSGNYDQKELETDKKKFRQELSKVQNTSKTETYSARKSKAKRTKPKESPWDQVKKERNAKGSQTAEKIKKQREARDSKKKKDEVKDPKKKRSRPFPFKWNSII